MAVTVSESAAFLRARQRRAEAAVGARAERVRGALPEAAAMLRARYGATKVWLFGSYAMGRLHAESDVDLAVSGVPSTRIDAAHADVEALLGGVVDLVPIEGATATLAQRIHDEGVLL